MVDAANPLYIPKEIIDKAIDFIKKYIDKQPVLVHCNLGMSRSATIGLLYLASIGYYKEIDFHTAEQKFINIYPGYSPSRGMRGFAVKNWEYYQKMC
ncbi:MAG: dual specificity protein phosphatase family protein [Candidatus Marinimicrobia bacterium]|nr:dual specificity protein phosphatase family protein [Candidatus Neomarinimicrobiota bacterium]